MKKLEGMTGFYYIGTHHASIEKLIRIYGRGYASESPQQAFTELTLADHFLPEVICCSSHFGLQAIKPVARLLAGHARLSRIPFILDMSITRVEENHHFVRNRIGDDVLHVAGCDEKNLAAKIHFLRKFKDKAAEFDKQKGKPFSVQVPVPRYSHLKRSFDMVIALVALGLLAPLFVLIAIVIRAESKGPVFYISKRAGRGYRIFDFYKFRTMFDGADRRIAEFAHLNQYAGEKGALFFKINEDPRITRVGRFLRNTSLDELPQLVNVLIGNMSIVGNRPLPLYEAAALTTDILAKRFLAPAGITGLWQIRKRGKAEMSVQERINLDIDYANNSNFLTDLWIMANTPQALIQRANA